MQVHLNTMEDAANAALRAYAERAGGDLAKAASEGYPVKAGALTHIAERVRQIVRKRGHDTWPAVIVGGSAEDERLELEERDSPRSFAFDALEAAKEAIVDIENAADGGPPLPEGVTVEAGTISRATYKLSGSQTRMTVVPIYVESEFGGSRMILVRAEE